MRRERRDGPVCAVRVGDNRSRMAGVVTEFKAEFDPFDSGGGGEVGRWRGARSLRLLVRGGRGGWCGGG
jgi:hypothetical protein